MGWGAEMLWYFYETFTFRHNYHRHWGCTWRLHCCCRSGLQGRNVAGKHKECLHRDNGIQGSRKNVALGDGSAATDTCHMPAEVMVTWLTLHEQWSLKTDTLKHKAELGSRKSMLSLLKSCNAETILVAEEKIWARFILNSSTSTFYLEIRDRRGRYFNLCKFSTPILQFHELRKRHKHPKSGVATQSLSPACITWCLQDSVTETVLWLLKLQCGEDKTGLKISFLKFLGHCTIQCQYTSMCIRTISSPEWFLLLQASEVDWSI